VRTSWVLHPSWSSSPYNTTPVPECVQFRFKTVDLTTTTNIPYSQSLFELGNISEGIHPTLILTYTGSGYSTASYSYLDSGSNYSNEYQYGKLDFIPNPQNYPNESASIYLPFYNGGWWSVMINWDTASGTNDTFTLYAGNKLSYDGYDGNQIGFFASSSVISTNSSWESEEANGMFFGLVGSIIGDYTALSGSFQEIRYYSQPISENSFRDFIMNPSYINDDINNDYLAFRAPLGSELYMMTSSIHPKVTGSWVLTSSFASNSNVFLINSASNFTYNRETVFLNSPIAGLRNRVTDKIQIVNQDLPPINLYYTQSGNTLSQYISIEQNYILSGSEIPDVNALEVALSPTNEIDDDIIASLGYFNIGDYIGDPRQISSSATSYPDLDKLALEYFQKYIDRYDLYDYIRLIKFFDNSLFKMIKDFVPARTNLRSGVVIKQHLLERNKYPQPQASWEDVTYTGSIDTAFFSGSTGGTFNEFNVLTNIQTFPFITSNIIHVTGSDYKNYFNISSSNILTYYPNDQIQLKDGEIITYFNGELELFTSGSNTPPGNTIRIILSSSLQGTLLLTPQIPTTFNYSSSIIGCSYGEKFSMWISDDNPGVNIVTASFGIKTLYPYSQQTWPEFEVGPTGSTYLIRDDQREFYNGELPGTIIEASNGELNEANIFKYPSTLEINYDIVFYKSDITPLENFTNLNTSPNQGEIYLWYDTGSNLSQQSVRPVR
jgi:hypothetical protein